MTGIVHVSHLNAWSGGLESDKDAWAKWAAQKMSIAFDNSMPKLEFTPPLFRRRLSLLSRMTVQTVHDVVSECPDMQSAKLVFASLRGEISRELMINRSLIKEDMIHPSDFSMSTFNTPVALATIALHLENGYSAIYPSRGDFRSAFAAACAPVLSMTEKNILFVYADEPIPSEYEALEKGVPLSFAAAVSAKGFYDTGTDVDISEADGFPIDFLKHLILQGAMQK